MERQQIVSRRRRPKPSERGQVLVLFVLISVTLFLIAVLSTAVGQALVRRHQAQMMADAAAWAGASKQAEGMNIIARYNEKSVNLIQGIHASMQVPYMDSEDTTWVRVGIGIFSGGIGAPFYNDWVDDVLDDYQKIFDGIDNYIQAVNIAYGTFPGNVAPTQPNKAAKRVVEANFCNGGDCLFKEADLKGHGAVLEPELAANIGRLVRLGNKKEYKFDIPIVDGYTYVPYVDHFAVTCVPGPYCINYLGFCCLARGGLAASYGVMLAYFRLIKPVVDPTKYEFGRFYDNPSGQDVRFTYYVELESSPVIFGRSIFDDIPPILAVATGKPYGGYLGTELERGLTWSQRSGREISYTYKAKLVPTRLSTVLMAGAQSGNGSGTRFLTVVH